MNPLISKASPILLLSLFTVGCISLGPPPPSANFPTSFEIAPAANALHAGLKIDYDDVLDDDDLDDTLGENNNVVIPAFRVIFATSDKASASEGGGRTLGGGQSSGANARMSVALSGVTQADLQEIVNAAYADLSAQLTAAGRNVISVDKLRKTAGYHAVDFTDPTGKHPFNIESKLSDPRSYTVMSATGLPLWFTHLDLHSDKSSFDLNNFKAINSVSAKLKAVTIIPVITVKFVEMESSGHGQDYFGGASAEVSADIGVRITAATYTTGLFENAMVGKMGTVRLEETLHVKGDFGKLITLTSKDSGGLATGIFRVAGVSASTNALAADPAKFNKLVLKGIQALNKGFVSYANENKP